MECADIGAMCNIPINCEISSCDADFSDEAKVITDVQLNYTFYKTFNFTRNQQIFITSSSVAPHKLMFSETVYAEESLLFKCLTLLGSYLCAQ